MMIPKLTGLLTYVLPHRQAIFVLASDLSHDAPLQMPPLAGFSSETLLFLVCIAVVVIFVIQSALDALLSRGWTVVGRRMVYAVATDMFARSARGSALVKTFFALRGIEGE